MPVLSRLRRSLPRMQTGRRLTAVNLVCVAGLCLVSALMLWDMRREAAQRAEIAARSLVQVIERDIARNIDLYDLSLQAVVDGMKREDVAQAAPELRRMVLFDRAASALGFGFIFVLDEGGDVVLNSQSAAPRAVNRADSEYFRYFAAHADEGLHVSPPAISRLSGQWVVMLSRRLSKPDGTFAGVVVGAIHLDYFRGLFAAARAHSVGSVTLFGPGGSVLMREPYDPRTLGTSVAGTPSYRRLLAAKEGSFVGPAIFGEGERHFVFTHLADQPLQVVTALTPGDIYADWWPKALSLGSVVLGLCGATVWLTALFRRELAQRCRAEQATAALNAELERLATTDALTGLSNRRRFDEVLDREWGRAARTDQPLSLILLDADWFKGFNDRYGHQAGDEALRLIAQAMRAILGRGGDTGYRIGGEEFAVILAGTDAAGARTVAERIREAVSGRRVPHAASVHGILTISCGIAGRPDAGIRDAAALVGAADEALYEAKRVGRDRACILGRSAPMRLVAR